MPDADVREMVADWHGASRAYEGHWDISEWVGKQLPDFKLHPETSALIHKVLKEAGYTWAQEGGGVYTAIATTSGEQVDEVINLK